MTGGWNKGLTKENNEHYNKMYNKLEFDKKFDDLDPIFVTRRNGRFCVVGSCLRGPEDDQYFRESMRTLMRSLGYNVEAFSSAADFLASPRLPLPRIAS